MSERARKGPLPRASEPVVDARVLFVTLLATLLAVAAGVVARVLSWLLDVITNLAFFGRISSVHASPWDHRLGLAVIGVPVIGGLLVGALARWGSSAIRGHGIPEAMERVLEHDSKIPARLVWLKPLSAALAIGTGGPFGAEGPIIATGGALGSLLGQVVRTTTAERRTLLAAGAAAGMSATFGSPVSAVLLAIELLLFELGPRSLLPVAFAAAMGTAVRNALGGGGAPFPMPVLSAPSAPAFLAYVAIGAVVGLAAVLVTGALHAVEGRFEKLPIHWMWWPALGAVVVGVVGYFEPRTLGVGYENIQRVVTGEIAGRALLLLTTLKLVSWLVALGSGTSGGTLAPLFTIGGGLGALLGALIAGALPSVGVDVRLAAVVGMASMFSGASRALLASVVFAFETTREPMTLLPLLGGCAAAYIVSSILMRHSIMTKKIAERGVRVPTHYGADVLARATIEDFASREVVTLPAEASIEEWQRTLSTCSYRAFPVIDARGALVGVVTREELSESRRPSAPVSEVALTKASTVGADETPRDALLRMIADDVSRVVVVDPRGAVVGILTRRDIFAAHAKSLREERHD